MKKNILFETLKELAEEQSKRESELEPNQNKSKKGSDSAAANYIITLMNQTKFRNPAKSIHDSIFGS